MNSSGIKRGLATSAIAALAITGIPAIANAETLAEQSAAGVDLRSVPATGGVISVAPDGANSTFSLVATAPAGVEFVSFYYRPAGSTDAPGAGNTVLIGTAAAAASGEYQFEWAPPVGLSSVDVLAVASNAAGTPSGTADLADDATITGTLGSVEIAGDAETKGYFAQPNDGTGDGNAYASGNRVLGLSGTTSGTDVSLVAEGPDGSLGVAAGTFTVGAANASGIRQWVGTVNVQDSAVDANTTADQILPVVASNSTSRDAEGFNIEAQQIRGISATSGAVNPDTGVTNVTVTVVDQAGRPIAGASVVAEGAGAGTEGGDSTAITNGRGQATFINAQAGTRSYYVNTTDDSVFNVGQDYRASVTIEQSRASAITFSNEDGLNFDIDEYANGEMRVRVTDAAGNPLPGQRFFYAWNFAPFDTDEDNNGVADESAQSTSEQSVVTDANGYAAVNLPVQGDFAASVQDQVDTIDTTGGAFTLNGYVNRDGSNPGQDPVDLALETVVVKAGESIADWDGPALTDRQTGTTQTITGTLKLADGTPLAGRTLDVTYANGGGGANSALATTQPAGTTRLSSTTARVVTGEGGAFAVAITDPATPENQTETGTLTVTGTAFVGTGSTAREGVGVDATDQVQVRFSPTATPASIVLDQALDLNGDTSDAGTGNGVADGDEDAFVELIDNAATPGRPVTFRVRAVNAAGGGLAGQQITLTTDHGFFTTGPATDAQLYTRTAPADNVATPEDESVINATATPRSDRLVADPTPTAGSLYGEWVNGGKTTTVTTDGSGWAYVTVAIERDEAFDDDGAVTSIITASAGTATNTDRIAVNWTSTDALNPGSVEVAPSEESARVGDEVELDVFAKDQFGNLTADTVTLSDNTPDAGFIVGGVTSNGAASVTSQFLNDDAAAAAYAEEETTQAITATWQQASNTYVDGNPALAGFQGVRNTVANNQVSDTAEIAWYEAVITDATVTLESSPEGAVPVGTAVTETITVLDEEGNPVPNVLVRFTHAGAGAPADAVERRTNAQGQAFYVVTSAEAGDALITAVVETSGAPVTKTDTVTFAGDEPEGPFDVTASLRGKNNGAKPDRLRVVTETDHASITAEGATVKLFKVVNGRARLVATKTINANEKAFFKVADRNGKKQTTYFAKVMKTENTKFDKSNLRRIR